MVHRLDADHHGGAAGQEDVGPPAGARGQRHVLGGRADDGGHHRVAPQGLLQAGL
eukprot:CAMPEP_0194566230 /NCGR_PEP_ID=MMETSP0292-20121207/5199_1 /TAXON_ID=39354 /ORGANISM="Heterosigma akashiwo, Strain CCMP2393" /LENGTH=54 /DNA_ID=CAMNT_0039415779 /DNA_START=441 /DNA_END=602 /DNA_ORIENTATION=+